MAAARKHIPERTCVICRQKAAKRSLIRLVRTAEGVQVDLSGKRNGRGAYLCHQPACWQRAVQGDALAKALRTTLSDADRAYLQAAALQFAAQSDEAS
ncbi:MAG: DUF448 domain-containing protein [Candidatus Thermofonsia Clade 1 bacterium]|uniref:DUF448 domain-containing protein n=1 Tax=Candidatus Thermofonsia Clade 1 bacterium TaxID=2364210 RepID=A0A2M8P0W5_9CHLR|nr:MAG: DUF448 domain-containing protein [Candidatus Thermofonsia Clade 1 bacterium]